MESSNLPSLTPDRWRRLREIFQLALPLIGEDRRRLLERECAGDRDLLSRAGEMLAAHEAPGRFLDDPILDLGSVSDSGLSLPAAVGPYRPVRLLGQGGMGSVLLARREDDTFEQEVAIKLLRPGLMSNELLRRFRRERQILANLDHPNVARLFDGGATEDGQPYLVMEYVQGLPLDAFCRQGDLSIEDRIRLLLPVCAAVQAAHRNLIVHRDLKPGNVMVTADGVPKLLDFGIAKLMRPETFPETVLPTEPGFMPMTPEFASPEQVEGAVVTTASDVYSLGAVLYAILTGSSPHRLTSRSPAEVVRVICHEEVALASSSLRQAGTPQGEKIARQLEGDLDQILRKALSKEVERRYPSVEALAADLQAYLAGHPVQARGDGFFYRTGKLLRRHRFETAFIAAGLAGLVAFTALLWVQQQRLIQERDLAQSTSSLLADLFRLPDPTRALGETVKARQILDLKAAELERELGGSPRTLATLRDTMGTSYANLGLYEEAAAQLERSLALRRRSEATADAEFAATLLSLAGVRSLQGRFDDAEVLSRHALDLSRRLEDGAGPLTAGSLVQLGQLLEKQGSFRAAEAAFQEGLDLARSAGASTTLAAGLDDYATLLQQVGRNRAAVAAYQEALEVRRNLHGEVHPELASSLNNLALLVNEESPQRAGELLGEALRMQRLLYGEKHPFLASTLNNLGLVHAEAGDLEAAERLYEEAGATLGNDALLAPLRASILNNLADLRRDQGRLEVARALHEEALALRRRLYGDRHWETAASLSNLGELHGLMGDLQEARNLLAEALGLTAESLGRHHPQTAAILNNLAQVTALQGEPKVARRYLSEAVETLRGSLGPGHPRLAPLLINLGTLAEDEGDLAEAVKLYREAVRIGKDTLGRAHPDTARYEIRLGGALKKEGEVAAAVDLLGPACGVLEASYPGGDPWLLACRRILGESLVSLGRYAEAEPVLTARWQALREERGDGAAKTLEARAALDDLDRRRADSPQGTEAEGPP